MKKYGFFLIAMCFICTFAFADEGHEHSGDRIKELINQPLTIQLAIVALVVSFVLGGLHALTPGHGKAIVAAYLVGSKGRVIDAIFLGVVVTFTHTISVIALGLVMLTAQSFAPEDIVPWLSLFSGALIAIIGVWLLIRNIKQYSTKHSHGHSHGHSHDHGHGHSHDHSHSERTSFGGLLSLGISGGIVPCVDALIGLLFAISLNKLVWGLIILGAFSLGLAAVLVAIGILMVIAKPVIESFTGEGIWLKRLPIVSAFVVILLGAILVAKAINSVGIQI